jgi:hypothetical protein
MEMVCWYKDLWEGALSSQALRAVCSANSVDLLLAFLSHGLVCAFLRDTT